MVVRQRRQWMSVCVVDVVLTAVAVDATETVTEALVRVVYAWRTASVPVAPHLRRQLRFLPRRRRAVTAVGGRRRGDGGRVEQHRQYGRQ